MSKFRTASVMHLRTLSEMPAYQATLTLIMMLLVIFTCVVIYNAFFHPLALFPGPFTARSTMTWSSQLWRFKHTLGGRLHQSIQDLHEQYGSVVRISPNELSFASVAAWKDVYGSPAPGKRVMPKSDFYTVFGSSFESGCIGSERDPKEHRRMRTSLSPAFSVTALLEQEHLVASVVDAFVHQIGQRGGDASGIDLTAWSERLAFDLMGEMAFGESFHCVKTESTHPWMSVVLDHLFWIILADNLRRLPLVTPIASLFSLVLARFNTVQKKHISYTETKVSARLKSITPRKDFFAEVSDKVQSGEIQRTEMMAHASTIVIAGGDSVASALAGLLFHLLKPSSANAYEKLRQEVRSRYKQYANIDWSTAQHLPYLKATIREGLRIFPPGHGLPRTSLGQVVDGYVVPKGAEVFVSPWTMNRSSRYFTNPTSFEPERWLDTESPKPSKDTLEASQPFLLGPRSCLGRNFAMMELSQVLAKLVWSFDMELVNQDMDFDGQCRNYVMWWKPAMYVTFRQAHGQ